MDYSPIRNALDALVGDRLPCAGARVSIGGKNVFEYHAGFSDEENGIEVSEDTRFAVYSLTKPLTACCALRLYERGRLNLYAPISEYLPEFYALKVLIDDAAGKRLAPAQNAPTVYDLLTMGAGFGDDMRLLPKAPTREAVRALAARPLLFEPGTRWLYGLCYEVLGALLEEVCSLKLRDVFRREIFSPCGMEQSCFLSEIGDCSSLAPVYRASGSSYAAAPLDLTYAPHPLYDSGGAGLVTNMRDYERFTAALMAGKLVSPETLSFMTRDHLCAAARSDFNWPQTRGYGYGLGVRTPLAGGKYRDSGWGGAAGAYWLMDFEKGAALCFFTNVLGADETVLYPLLRRAFYEAMEG